MEENPQCVPDSIHIYSLSDKTLFPCQGNHYHHHHQWVLELQETYRLSAFRELHVKGGDRVRLTTIRQSLHSVIAQGENRLKMQWKHKGKDASVSLGMG